MYNFERCAFLIIITRPDPSTLTHSETPTSGFSSKGLGGEESAEVLAQTIHPTSKDEALGDGGILISAAKGDGLTELLLKIQDEVLRATKQKFFKIIIPADGAHLR